MGVPKWRFIRSLHSRCYISSGLFEIEGINCGQSGHAPQACLLVPISFHYLFVDFSKFELCIITWCLLRLWSDRATPKSWCFSIDYLSLLEETRVGEGLSWNSLVINKRNSNLRRVEM